MKVIVSLLCLVAVSQAAVLCPKNACDSITCDAKLTAESCMTNGGKMKTKGGFCQCCDVCIQQLGEGADCTASMLLGPAPSTSECTGELHCDSKSRQCQKPTCAMKKTELEGWLAKQPMRPGGFEIPVCDDDGSYAGKQCSGSECYCVDPTGKSIGWTHQRSDTSDKVTCQCARDLTAYMARGIIGRLFHCSNKGDYQPVQCHGSVCFCADRKTGKQITGVSGVHISAKDKLNC